LLDDASTAHLFGFFNLEVRGFAVTRRKEQVRILVATCCHITPISRALSYQ
jgi:hypothetical protein